MKRILLFTTLLSSIFLLFGCNVKEDQTNDTNVVEGEKKVYLGDEHAEKEVLLVFDYSCPYCTQWAEEILPTIEEDYIQSNKVKFRMQSMSLLNENSLRLSKFDQNLKEYYPKKYYDITLAIFKDAPKSKDESSNDYGSITYIEDLVKKYNLDESKMLNEPSIDVLSITRQYTKALNVEAVPSVFIDGVFVNNPFDMNEIIQLLEN